MPRNMGFSITTEQVRNKTKFVTRRLGWWFLKPGDIVNAVEKAMGLKKGEKIKQINQIRIISTIKQSLYVVDKEDIILEGFSGYTTGTFIRMFCRHNKCDYWVKVNRIEFEYL